MTQYFKKDSSTNYTLENVPLNNENLWFVQLDGGIRTAFMKYDVPLPKFVIVEFYNCFTDINIVRDDVSNISEADKWLHNKVFVFDELQKQAEANSNEENGLYRIKIA